MVKAEKEMDQDFIKRSTIKDMKKLGVYKTEYDRVITIYAELVAQFNRMTKQFAEANYKSDSEGGQGGSKKSPIVATMETLRKDILAYSDRLCLNPKALDSVDIKTKKKSNLSAALAALK